MGETSATVTLNGNQVSCPVRSGSVGPDVIDRKMKDFSEHSAYHAKAIQAVIDSQLDPVAAANIAAAGGAGMILERVVQILEKMVCSKS